MVKNCLKNCVSLIVPSAPPESLKAWNLSSTSVQVQWGSIPFGERHGKILGYNVKITSQQQKHGRRTSKYNYTTSRSLKISGLRKYCNYTITVCALTRRGKGPSRVVIVQTDEDGKNTLVMQARMFVYLFIY